MSFSHHAAGDQHALPTAFADAQPGPCAGPWPTLRAGFEGSGSPRWLMRTLQRGGFDRSRGFVLDLVLLSEAGHRHGTLQALADGRVHLVDADQQALAAAQADGLPLVAIAPYGRILGSLLVHRDYRSGGNATGRGGVRGSVLDSLRGGVLGALSTRDKNWRLLARACRQLADFDLATEVTVIEFQQRAELVAALDAGRIDAALLHWHLVPALVAAGHCVLAELPDLADALAKTELAELANAGADAVTNARADLSPSASGGAMLGDQAAQATAATTFFVVHQQLAQQQPALIAALVAATAQALSQLRDDPLAWQALALEGAVDARHVAALRARWQDRVGACHPRPPNSTHSTNSTNSTQSPFRSTSCNPF